MSSDFKDNNMEDETINTITEDNEEVVNEVVENPVDDDDKIDSDDESDDDTGDDDDIDDDSDDDSDDDGDVSELVIDTPREILMSRIESIIFISTEPVSVRRLAKHLSLPGKYVRKLTNELIEHYKGRGVILAQISNGYRFTTNPENASVLRELTKVKPLKMSRPALETLAIVAYKQPCTRAEIEDVRRVDCGGTLKFLFEKELIRVLGRKEEPGRPMIYGTSNKFLEMFQLKNLSELPSLREYTELWEEHVEMVDDVTKPTEPAKTQEKHGPFEGGPEKIEEEIAIKDLFDKSDETETEPENSEENTVENIDENENLTNESEQIDYNSDNEPDDLENENQEIENQEVENQERDEE
ncbi:MAG: SMC-Scp complex subunit ScpB [Deltaproteobacteria bacterium]|nr:SMC-Scp complex subunit ScpB [Deltaproteobacteria bacterium]